MAMAVAVAVAASRWEAPRPSSSSRHSPSALRPRRSESPARSARARARARVPALGRVRARTQTRPRGAAATHESGFAAASAAASRGIRAATRPACRKVAFTVLPAMLPAVPSAAPRRCAVAAAAAAAANVRGCREFRLQWDAHAGVISMRCGSSCSASERPLPRSPSHRRATRSCRPRRVRVAQRRAPGAGGRRACCLHCCGSASQRAAVRTWSASARAGHASWSAPGRARRPCRVGHGGVARLQCRPFKRRGGRHPACARGVRARRPTDGDSPRTQAGRTPSTIAGRRSAPWSRRCAAAAAPPRAPHAQTHAS